MEEIKRIETFKDYDWRVLKYIDYEVLKLRENNKEKSMTEIQNEVIKEVDKITNFKKVEADMERVTGFKKGDKVLTSVFCRDYEGDRCCDLEVVIIKRLKIHHYMSPVNVIRVEIVEPTRLNDWGISIDSVYNLDRLTKMLSKER